MKKNVAVKFTDGDLKRSLLASSEGVAPRDDTTLRMFKLKHPPSPAVLALFPAAAGQEDITKTLSFFRSGSAGCPGGLRPGHLLALVSGKATEESVRLPDGVYELIVEGEVPEIAKSIF